MEQRACSSSEHGEADQGGQSLDGAVEELQSCTASASSESNVAESLGVRAALLALSFYKGMPTELHLLKVLSGCHTVDTFGSGSRAVCQVSVPWHTRYNDRACATRSRDIAAAAKVLPLFANVLRVQHASVQGVRRGEGHCAHSLAPTALQPAFRRRI